MQETSKKYLCDATYTGRLNNFLHSRNPNKDSKAAFLNELNHLKTRHSIGTSSGQIALAFVVLMETYFNSQSPKDQKLDLSWLYDLIGKDYERQSRITVRKAINGALVDELIKFGCSRLQAINAIAEWRRASETSVRDAHVFHRKMKTIDGEILANNDWINYFLMRTLVNKKGRFPTTFPKAQSAMMKIKAHLEVWQFGEGKEFLARMRGYAQK